MLHFGSEGWFLKIVLREIIDFIDLTNYIRISINFL